VNIQYTQDLAKSQGGVYPNGQFKVYGDFCWGGEKDRRRGLLPAVGSAGARGARGHGSGASQTRAAAADRDGMKGTALETSDTFVSFQAPDKDKILAGSGEQAVVRLVIYDNKAHRTSGVTSASIIQLKGTTQPLPLILI